VTSSWFFLSTLNSHKYYSHASTSKQPLCQQKSDSDTE